MLRTLFVLPLLFITSFSTLASTTTPSNSLYVLQLASNLGCESLEIELLPESGEKAYALTYNTSAYAAVALKPGNYQFGKVSCEIDGTKQVMNILEGQLPPLNLTEEKIYFGGKLIFKQSSAITLNDAPDVLDNCPRHTSRARGTPNNSCRDGNGISTGPKKIKKVDVFAPIVEEKDISIVRNAFNVTESEIAYLPLQQY